jgi:hypothetical protein
MHIDRMDREYGPRSGIRNSGAPTIPCSVLAPLVMRTSTDQSQQPEHGGQCRARPSATRRRPRAMRSAPRPSTRAKNTLEPEPRPNPCAAQGQQQRAGPGPDIASRASRTHTWQRPRTPGRAPPKKPSAERPAGPPSQSQSQARARARAERGLAGLAGVRSHLSLWGREPRGCGLEGLAGLDPYLSLWGRES